MPTEPLRDSVAAHQVHGELPLPEVTPEQKAEMRRAIEELGREEFERQILKACEEWVRG